MGCSVNNKLLSKVNSYLQASEIFDLIIGILLLVHDHALRNVNVPNSLFLSILALHID